MRKMIAAAIAAMMVTSAVMVSAEDISVKVNGEKVVFSDVQPVMKYDTTLIPVRSIFETLGWEVVWDEDNDRAIIGNDNSVIFVTIGDYTMEVYDMENDTIEEKSLLVPAEVIDDRTMLPLRAVCEALGAEVDWEDETSTVYINY